MEPTENSLVKESYTVRPLAPAGAVTYPAELTSRGVFTTLSAEGSFLLDYITVLKKHRWAVMASLVICLTVAVILAVRATPMYTAIGRIAINRETPVNLGFKDQEISADDYDTSVYLETQSTILESSVLAFEVVKALDLQNNPEFNPVAKNAPLPPLKSINPDSPIETALLGRFRGGLKVRAVPGTRILEIRYTGPHPKLNAQIVNQLINTYIEQNYKTKYEATMETSDWLAAQLGDLRVKMETAQEKLVRYQRDNNIVGIDDKQNMVKATLEDLNKQLTAAEADRIHKDSIYRLVKNSDPELLVNREIAGTHLDQLRSKRAELKTQYARLTTQFGPSYPSVAALGSEIRQVEAEMRAETARLGQKVKNDYLAAVQREKLLGAAVADQRKKAEELNQSAIEYNIIKRDADSYRQLYEGLLQKMKEAGISAGLKSSNVRVVDSARVPTSPVSPNMPRSVAMGLILGLLGGVAAAFILESLDNTVRTPEQAEMLSALPSVGVIPLAGRKLRKTKEAALAANSSKAQYGVTAITVRRPLSELSESYRSLRTSILLSAGGAPKVLLVSSPLPQDGKSTVAVNTAVVLAQKGSRVLLVDADMRRPSIHRHLGIPQQPGLSAILAQAEGAESAVHASAVPGLFVVPAGHTPPQPTELLGSPIMKAYLENWRQEYDHIIIDSPPILSVTDAVILSVESDSVLLIARSGQTTKAALRRARDMLIQVNARIMGVVLNAMDVNATDYRHHYFYKSKQKYYNNDARAGAGASEAATAVNVADSR
ncbi:MAG: GumC family protein [Terriglobales bacterium]